MFMLRVIAAGALVGWSALAASIIPGDARRGKQAFAAKHCAECHGITSSPLAAAPPVAKWESLADPTVLAQQMWNHGGKMRAEFSKKKLAWSTITAQELTDMLVYLQN